jgi:hypothetical protein
VREPLEDRVRRIRGRVLVRSWEYRQRHHAKGVWYRLRRVLVDAAEAWAIDEEAADALERSGREPIAVGRELEPPKRLYSVSRAEIEALAGARRIPVRLCVELLEARSVALVAHAESGTHPR